MTRERTSMSLTPEGSEKAKRMAHRFYRGNISALVDALIAEHDESEAVKAAETTLVTTKRIRIRKR